MPLIATRGASSVQGFGQFAQQTAVNYIEDVFSTYLYTGTGSAQTITNGIDLSTKGGFVWIKDRTLAENHNVFDTARGAGYQLITNETGAQGFDAQRLSAFTTSGFSLGTRAAVNQSGSNFVSWTFRKQPKFFDIVTYTGNGSAPRNISHSLNSSPGFIVIKRTDSTGDWWAWHRSIANKNIYLNYTDAADSGTNPMISAVSSTNFTLATNQNATMNINGATYVAYLFAHDAGGFGLSGTDNVISCGSYTGAGANLNINLGYEPQWVMIKSTTNSTNWVMFDTMRGLPVSGDGKDLRPNLSDSEGDNSALSITSTGFLARTGIDGQVNANGYSYIYIAIRRGPMKVPTDATKVFSPNVPTAFAQFTTGFPVDLGMWNYRTGYSENTVVNDRLRGVSTTNVNAFPNNLITSSTVAEQPSQGTQNWNNTGLYAVTSGAVWYSFRRAPSFMDVVCWTGLGSGTQTIPHNLGAVPELMLVKRRSTALDWYVYSATTGATNTLILNTTAASAASGNFGSTSPTSTNFYIGGGPGGTWVTYLFATCAGVSKVGTYTGTGAAQTINCGFTAGSRFIMIKRTDSTGDWYVWDSARGIIAGNDPYLLFNSIAAEVTSTDYVDTANSGFEISSTAPAAINANGGTYIFLAIA